MCRYISCINIGIFIFNFDRWNGTIETPTITSSFQMQKNQTTIRIHHECEGGI